MSKLSPIIALILLIMGAPLFSQAAASVEFDGGVVASGSSSSSGSSGSADVNLGEYAGKMRGLALAILCIFIIIGGLFVAAGKQGMALAVISAAIFMFGGGWIVISIAKALGRL